MTEESLACDFLLHNSNEGLVSKGKGSVDVPVVAQSTTVSIAKSHLKDNR